MELLLYLASAGVEMLLSLFFESRKPSPFVKFMVMLGLGLGVTLLLVWSLYRNHQRLEITLGILGAGILLTTLLAYQTARHPK